jgi:hypothetical protein
VADLAEDGALGQVRLAEVALQDAAQPVEVLRRRRLVESQLAVDAGALLFRHLR